MDDSRQEILACVGLAGGVYLLYQGIVAWSTKVAHVGRGMLTLQNNDAMVFGWVAFVAGVVLLLIAGSHFWKQYRS